MDYLLEVCVDNVESVRNAIAGGAHRLEICSALEEGGLTPSHGFIRRAKEASDVPVHVMIRPRAGDFVYDEGEIEVMKRNIRVALSLGANGFVFGALEYDKRIRGYEIDRITCHTLINETAGRPVTFHRAFDLIKHSGFAVTDLISVGFHRILTSGQAPTAYEGRRNLQTYVMQGRTNIIIMPGCGINETNLEDLINATGAKEYHSSARYRVNPVYEDTVVKGTDFYHITSSEVVQDMVDILRSR